MALARIPRRVSSARLVLLLGLAVRGVGSCRRERRLGFAARCLYGAFVVALSGGELTLDAGNTLTLRTPLAYSKFEAPVSLYEHGEARNDHRPKPVAACNNRRYVTTIIELRNHLAAGERTDFVGISKPPRSSPNYPAQARHLCEHGSDGSFLSCVPRR